MNPIPDPSAPASMGKGHPPSLADRARNLSITHLAEKVRAEQRREWLRGRRVPVETFLEKYPTVAADGEAALDLIYAEYALRQELSEEPEEEEYYRRFPQHQAALRRQFCFDQLLLGPESGAPDEPPPLSRTAGAPAPGTIGKYPVITLLEEGGQATVYRALHPTLQRDVVIKLGAPPYPGCPDQREQLRQEGRILAELEHPNLAHVYDLDVDQGRVFLVMEYVRGQSLGQFYHVGRYTPRQAAQLVAQVADAVALAHGRGILHLDINPNNILIDAQGRPRLIDFGLARWRQGFRSEAGRARVTGTPEFMAPEQARGERERLGPASDIFALGGVLYYLLTGRPPFRGEDLADVLEEARRGRVEREPLATAPAALTRICLRALAPEPAERYAGAEEFRAALEAWATDRRLRGRLLALLIGPAVLLFGAVGVAAWQMGSPRGSLVPSSPRDSLTGSAVPAAVSAPLLPVREQPGLLVTVLSGESCADLHRLVPLRTGDRLQIRVEVAGPLYLSLFLVSSEGKLRLLTQGTAREGQTSLSYPAEVEEAVPLIGPAGTEFLLACGRRSRPIELEEVQRAWEGDGPWPALPAFCMVRLRRDRVLEEQNSRELGLPQTIHSPEAEVMRRLEDLRQRLQPYDYVEGIAFAHTD